MYPSASEIFLFQFFLRHLSKSEKSWYHLLTVESVISSEDYDKNKKIYCFLGLLGYAEFPKLRLGNL